MGEPSEAGRIARDDEPQEGTAGKDARVGQPRPGLARRAAQRERASALAVAAGAERHDQQRPASDSTRPIGLYVLDFATEKSRLVWPPVGNNHVGYLPFCVSPDGSHITIAVPAGDAWDLQTIPSDGRTGPKTIATLQEVDGTSIDESADGTIYLSDVRFPLELQWTRPGSSSSERELIAATPSRARVLPLADGRIVVGIAGRVLVRPRGGGSLQPFVQTQSPTFSPLATLGRDRVALIFREQADSGIAIVDVATGRVPSRVRHSWPADWSSLAGAPGVHGVVRATADIDFLYRPTKKNIARLCAAMMDFGAPAEVIEERRHRLRCALPRRRRNR